MRLKQLKRPLRELNKLHFSHILERVTRAEKDHDQLQTALYNDRDNLQLLTEDTSLHLRLVNLSLRGMNKQDDLATCLTKVSLPKALDKRGHDDKPPLMALIPFRDHVFYGAYS